jgi:hypothetical protein
MPINVLNAPLSEQAINFALGVQRFQLRSLVRQVRVITINLQTATSLKTSAIPVTEKKKGKEAAKKTFNWRHRPFNEGSSPTLRTTAIGNS